LAQEFGVDKRPVFQSDDELNAIGSRLLDQSLPKTEWTHRGHFAAALWLLVRRPEFNLAVKLPALIRAYNESTGVRNTDHTGYHETITLASIRAARAFLLGRPQEALFVSCNALMESPLGEPGWLFEYWSRERLTSVAARRNWIEPDLKSLPF
jgi:hypothetical protein